MRIGVFTWSLRRVGGTETYLDHVITELRRLGHDVALLYETDRPANRDRIRIPADVPTWSIEAQGPTAALEAFAEWEPDVVYSHGSDRHVALLRALAAVAPAVFFAHDYFGTCISGSKTFRVPTSRPCSRTFGPGCLVRYFPRRCGGLSPTTMWELYRLQEQRLEALRAYECIVVVSEHMREEYIRHGFDPSRVRVVPYVAASPGASERAEESSSDDGGGDHPSDDHRSISEPWQLLFIGRMDRHKGGEILLASLPAAARTLGRPLHLTFVGDGPERTRWEHRAKSIEGGGVTIDFAGFVPRADVAERLDRTDLVVVPSLWPEPFGRVGPEAGEHGVPAVAFDVGGVREWLDDGESGILAPGDPPTAAGLSAAIVHSLEDPVKHRRLSAGARRMAARFTNERHLEALLPILEEVAESRGILHRP